VSRDTEEGKMNRVWDRYLTDLDREVYAKAGFGHRAGFGTRPAILIIDVQYRTCGEKPRPILEAVDEYKTSCGESGWAVVAVIEKLLSKTRALNIPVLYPVVERKDRFDTGRWKDKVPSIADKPSYMGSRGTEIIESIAPRPGDVVVSKRYASAFFGTPLMTYLNDLDRDTVIVTGATTSGCVRATVADAFSYGFKVVVVEDGVFDRGEVSHAINLFDMDQKYADVLPSEKIIQYFDELSIERGDGL
jgi:nicotinamidase-related amidase